ncbi:unnamed protein product [Protopolystoma xenopodis]|uniref:Uncharacterized protein n=1 Tax=Protopolystoma xenopodis TaxID=117903 RepID=A0A3S5CJD3_9PLAT|nr:unnamed protein product [Protopolystoma xenopodis]
MCINVSFCLPHPIHQEPDHSIWSVYASDEADIPAEIHPDPSASSAVKLVPSDANRHLRVKRAQTSADPDCSLNITSPGNPEGPASKLVDDGKSGMKQSSKCALSKGNYTLNRESSTDVISVGETARIGNGSSSSRLEPDGGFNASSKALMGGRDAVTPDGTGKVRTCLPTPLFSICPSYLPYHP